MSLIEKLLDVNMRVGEPRVFHNFPGGTFNPGSSQIEMNGLSIGVPPPTSRHGGHNQAQESFYAPPPETTCLGGIVDPEPFTGGYSLPESGVNLSMHGDCSSSHYKPFGESSMSPTLNAFETAMADHYAKNIGLHGYGNPR